LATNPVTATLVDDLVVPTTKVMMNPASAETMFGAAAATAADAASMTYGLHQNSQLLNNWMHGNYN
jgi:hypothetical protein